MSMKLVLDVLNRAKILFRIVFTNTFFSGAVKRTCKLVACIVTPSKTTFAFSDPVLQSYVTLLTRLSVNNVTIKGKWMPCTGSYSDVLWIYEHNQEITSGMQIEVHNFSNVFKLVQFHY